MEKTAANSAVIIAPKEKQLMVVATNGEQIETTEEKKTAVVERDPYDVMVELAAEYGEQEAAKVTYK